MAQEPVALLRELVAIPSMNPYRSETLEEGYGEARLAEHVAAILRDAGLDTQVTEVQPGRPNVTARLDGPAGGEPVLFVAHLDTVPVEGMTIPPFEGAVRDGCLHGRGACDNKGSMAAMLTALRGVAAAGSNHSPIMFAATADEESGYRGVRALVEGGIAARMAIVGEPTRLNVVIAHKGAVRGAITTHGKSAHSSDPTKGANAIYRMAPLLLDLEKLAAELPTRPSHPLVGPPTLSVGTIHGGITVNTVPDRCTIEVDRRLLPGESPEDAAAEIRAIAERHGATMVDIFAGGPFEVPADAEVVSCACRAVAAELGEAHTIGVPFGTEASELMKAGIPTVVLGPGDVAKAHSADECVPIDQLDTLVRIYERIMTAE